MFKQLRNKLYEVERQRLMEILTNLVTSLEYLQVALKNNDGNSVDKWLGICSKHTRELSTSFSILKLFLVKE